MVLAELVERKADLAPLPSLSEWMERNIIFGKDDARPGPLALDPWQREVADATMTHRQTTLMAASQCGKSMLELGVLAYSIASGRKSMMSWPTKRLRDAFMIDKFMPLLSQCQAVRQEVLLSDSGKIHQEGIHLRSGGIVQTPSGSARGGAEQLSAAVVVLDETDKFRVREYQSDIVASYYQRSEGGYENPNLILAGTPEIAGQSTLAAHYEASDKRILLFLCALCDEWTPLEWDSSAPDGLYCQSCCRELTDEHKPAMLSSCRWEKQRPWVSDRAGFQVSQFASPVKSWAYTLSRYDAARPRDFQTQILGLPYSLTIASPLTEEELEGLFRLPPFAGRHFATVMVCDVQRRDGGELVYGQFDLYGNPYQPDVDFRWQRSIFKGNTREWADVFRQLRKEFRKERPDVLFVDAGDAAGVQVQPVVQDVFRSECGRGVVRSIKGYSSSQFEQWANDLPVKDGVTLRDGTDPRKQLLVCSGATKTQVYDLMGRGQVRLSGAAEDYHADVLKQLSSEELRSISTAGGQEKRQWKRKPGYRNEALDLLVYCIDAAAYLGPNYRRGRIAVGPDGQLPPALRG